MKMKLFAIIFIFYKFSFISSYSQRPCGLVTFNYRTYEKEFLLDGVVIRPFRLSYSQKSDIIMFHEDAEAVKNTKTYILNVKSKEVTEIKGFDHALGSVVDNDDFLIGTNNGIYKYDTTTKNVSLYDLENVTFYNIYIYNNIIYYIDYPKKDVYFRENNKSKVLFENSNIEAFAVDSAENYYFANASGWYYGNLKTKSLDFIAQSNEMPFDNFVINPNNEIVYVSSHYGVFKMKKDYGTLKRISNKAMLDFVFETNGDIIYSDQEHIVRLKPTDKSC